MPFQVDHIIAHKHGGTTILENLALACYFCNSYNGPNIAGLDPESKKLTRLFNPRRDTWANHFRWNGAMLGAHTAIGRTTIQVLRMNDDDALAIRASLFEEGLL